MESMGLAMDVTAKKEKKVFSYFQCSRIGVFSTCTLIASSTCTGKKFRQGKIFPTVGAFWRKFLSSLLAIIYTVPIMICWGCNSTFRVIWPHFQRRNPNYDLIIKSGDPSNMDGWALTVSNFRFSEKQIAYKVPIHTASARLHLSMDLYLCNMATKKLESFSRNTAYQLKSSPTVGQRA